MLNDNHNIEKMNFKFITNNGRCLEIDLAKWELNEVDRKCKIIEVTEGNILFENKDHDRFFIPESLIEANELKIIDNTVDLSIGLYENWFLKKNKAKSQEIFEKLYSKYSSEIFKNRTLVMNNPEYYLLRPKSLTSGFIYGSGISYNLGKLFESFESGNHVYYDDFCGYKKMYLVSMAASPLSGTLFRVVFWSDYTNEFVHFNSESNFPKNFGTAQGRALIEMLSEHYTVNLRQDVAIKKLIDEIMSLKKSRINS